MFEEMVHHFKEGLKGDSMTESEDLEVKVICTMPEAMGLGLHLPLTRPGNTGKSLKNRGKIQNSPFLSGRTPGKIGKSHRNVAQNGILRVVFWG